MKESEIKIIQKIEVILLMILVWTLVLVWAKVVKLEKLIEANNKWERFTLQNWIDLHNHIHPEDDWYIISN